MKVYGVLDKYGCFGNFDSLKEAREKVREYDDLYPHDAPHVVAVAKPLKLVKRTKGPWPKVSYPYRTVRKSDGCLLSCHGRRQDAEYYAEGRPYEAWVAKLVHVDELADLRKRAEERDDVYEQLTRNNEEVVAAKMRADKAEKERDDLRTINDTLAYNYKLATEREEAANKRIAELEAELSQLRPCEGAPKIERPFLTINSSGTPVAPMCRDIFATSENDILDRHKGKSYPIGPGRELWLCKIVPIRELEPTKPETWAEYVARVSGGVFQPMYEAVDLDECRIDELGNVWQIAEKHVTADQWPNAAKLRAAWEQWKREGGK